MRESGTLARQTFVVLCLAALFFLAWQVRDVFILVFGIVLAAATLDALQRPLVQKWGWSRRVSLSFVVITIIAILGAVAWFAGAAVADQARALQKELPDAVSKLAAVVEESPFGDAYSGVRDTVADANVPWKRVAGYASGALGGLSTVGLIVIAGVFLAADPAVYRKGLIRLFPVDVRGNAARGLDAAGQGLHRWLLGQFCSMAAVGAMTAIGLWALGMPLAFLLALIAGLLAFVPFFGPIIAGVLAVLLAFSESPTMGLYVALLFLGIQQVEGNLLMPQIQRWAVQLPPVLGLLAVVIFGMLFGIAGVVLATPLMVVVMILVQELYVKAGLEKQGEGTRHEDDDTAST
ncbi:AI-2E family transporter [Pigmentiphaga litoralis]|uniref:AI-2E family transporter n=1 Tax=Pigmentiphaga litoralis TaxID=516702 RepID=UPI00167223E5|nr:AI-2E family transporter [Pigmentiphaga litoralis]GGX27906.1 AI-2E family transporter [Pigmentiphaga litoralis]